MSTPTQLPATVQAKTEVEFIPFGSEDKIKLSMAVIRNYIATPTKQGDLPDDRACMRFLMLCRSRRLDPFQGDAFLIGFRKGSGEESVEWNLITAQSAFMKRAEIHPEFDGLESGIIVKDGEDHIIEREGDFEFEGDALLGGWAVIHFKSRKHPMKKKVTLKTYRKPFGVWLTDPAGMICKVAEVHALRDAFPTMLGGMMLREEHIDIDTQVTATAEIRRPEFARGLPAPDIGGQPAVRNNDNTRQTQPVKPAKMTQERPEATQTRSGTQTTQAPGKAVELAPSETVTTQVQEQPDENPITGTQEPAQTDEAPETHPEQAPQDRGEFKAKPGEGIPLTSVRRWLHEIGRTENELMTVLRNNKAAKEGQKLAELSEAKLDNCYRARANLATQFPK